jgi:CRP/FNR family cyclic AMP-dependent transcriptional regulator
MIETTPAHSLLALDPDLGQLLSPERRRSAGADLRARVVELERCQFDPRSLCVPAAAAVGLLTVCGVIAREIDLRDGPSAELFGPGDVIRTWQADAPPALLETGVRWTAVGPASLAVLDRPVGMALWHYPEVMAVVLDRIHARAERLAVTQAISQLTGVDTRVEALLHHLAERWGRVTSAGVVLPVALSHHMIGSLVGARRQTVSAAAGQLATQGRVTRRMDGGWLLAAEAAAPSRIRTLAA